uniref:Uncharacterized protein n=1 Tax=Oxytricha trifallax TaxID=1172189 RepID=G9HRJ3_9SPIT|nr:hypothetical protein [Oxytricha trifallax]
MFLILKFPQNLILDYSINRSAYSVKHWIHNFENSINLIYKIKNLSVSQHLLLKKNFYSFFFASNFKLLTLKKQRPFLTLKNKKINKKSTKESLLNKFKTNSKSKESNKARSLSLALKTIFSGSKYGTKYKTNAIFNSVLKPSFFSSDLKGHSSFFKNLFDINFLRKERIYTKLKYSRVPQYDTVSGAAAALLAGFFRFFNLWKIWFWTFRFWWFLFFIYVLSFFSLFVSFVYKIIFFSIQ